MVVADLLKISCEILKLLSRYDVKVDDNRFVDMYYDYEARRKEKEKYIFIVTELAQKYKVSPSTIERAVRRLRNVVKL